MQGPKKHPAAMAWLQYQSKFKDRKEEVNGEEGRGEGGTEDGGRE